MVAVTLHFAGLLPAPVESEERGQLPMKPCVQGSLPAAACDDTVTSIKPQRSSFIKEDTLKESHFQVLLRLFGCSLSRRVIAPSGSSGTR